MDEQGLGGQREPPHPNAQALLPTDEQANSPTREAAHEAHLRPRAPDPHANASAETAIGAGEDLAVAQGKAYQRALDVMLASAATAGKQYAGDYLVAYSIERARGMYRLHDGHWAWTQPTAENIHLQIMVADRYDGRFIPGLEIYVLLFDGAHNELGERRQQFNWHPWLYHYGRNWSIAASGIHHIRVRIEIPDFPRHDHQLGVRYGEPIEVDFRKVHIQVEPAEQ